MIKKFKQQIKNSLNKLWHPNTYSSEAYIGFLRSKGCEIGEGNFFFEPLKTIIDTTRPYLLKIGAYCKITSGVIILTHDYSRSVLRRVYGDIVESAGQTVIGDNVFIGMNAVILMNTKIGNNVIIGAGSVVTKNIPDNTVAAGNPARVLCTLEEYYNKRKKLYIEEAKSYAKRIYEKTGGVPTLKDMGCFYPLYLKRDLIEIKNNNLLLNMSGDNSDEIAEYFLKSEPVYQDFDEFLRDCGIYQSNKV
jgi:acetyltransferase-like isoleucine patch superfamily enzyme